MNDNSQLLSHEAPALSASTVLLGKYAADCSSSLGSVVNQDWLGEQCPYRKIDMSSHNAACIYCAHRGNAGMSGYAFD
jgi:hypothetical protein